MSALAKKKHPNPQAHYQFKGCARVALKDEQR
jgi:hypothetical protein